MNISIDWEKVKADATFITITTLILAVVTLMTMEVVGLTNFVPRWIESAFALLYLTALLTARYINIEKTGDT